LRADRLGVKGEGLYLLAETDFEVILQRMEEISPSLGVIDSIQTVYLRELEGAPGSISQIRECTLRLMQWAKLSAVPLLITGHVTKEGAIAGPKALEHIVDVVLYLEGESFSTYRLLRGVKNRFGSTNEVGIFEMREQGLVEVENPSQVFLSQRSKGAIGSVVSPTLEGTRPLLVEMQALTTTTSFGLPRRTANGIDFNRLLLIIAVLTKRAGLKLFNQDIIVNVVGGLKISEPAADLAVALSIASSFSDKEVDPHLVAVGEVGLSGEVRGVPQLERRLIEAARQGFTRCVGPRVSLSSLTPPQGMETIAVNSLREALKVALKPRQDFIKGDFGETRNSD
jgi:DNA repair protein RadA/Sms